MADQKLVAIHYYCVAIHYFQFLVEWHWDKFFSLNLLVCRHLLLSSDRLLSVVEASA